MTFFKRLAQRGLSFNLRHRGDGKNVPASARRSKHTALTPSADASDRRQSASMATGIASSMVTAALAVLAIIGAIVTYIATNYEHLGLFFGFHRRVPLC